MRGEEVVKVRGEKLGKMMKEKKRGNYERGSRRVR